MNVRSKSLCVALIAIAGVVVYANTFRNGFVWDDYQLVLQNEYVRDWRHIGKIFASDICPLAEKSAFYRPLQILSYMADYAAWKSNPAGYHLTNLLFHIANGILVFCLVAALTVSSPKQGPVALAVALLWIVHPLHAQCVAYIAGRADLLVAFFLLGMAVLIVDGRGKILPVICFALALLSKEAAVAGLFIVPLCLAVKNEPGRKVPAACLPYLVVAAAYLALRLTVLRFPDAPEPGAGVALYPRLLTSLKAVVILLRVAVVPYDLSMSRNIPWATSIFSPEVILACVGLALVACYICLVRDRKPELFFGAAWFCAAYLPYAGILAINANVSEHWMYLPSVGLSLIAVTLLAQARFRAIFAVCVGLLVIAYGDRAFRRNADFMDEITLFSSTLQHAPDVPRLHYNLGNAYAREGAYDKAIASYRMAAALKPDYIEAYANLGVAYDKVGRSPAAEKMFARALALNPRNLPALIGRGILYGRAGDLDKAGRLFELVLTLDPSNREAAINLQEARRLMAPPR